MSPCVESSNDIRGIQSSAPSPPNKKSSSSIASAAEEILKKQIQPKTVVNSPSIDENEKKALLSAFDGKVAYRFLRKPLTVFLKNFEEKQLYVSARRGIARLRDLDIDAKPINILFNPLANDEKNPIQLTELACDRASVSWKSIFTLNRDPLEINIPNIQAIFDATKPKTSPIVERRIRTQWLAAVGEEFKIPTGYPPVEGASYNIDQIVLICKHVETPLPGYPNATIRLGMRDLTAISVDREGEASNLRICWNSFNPTLIKARRQGNIPANNISYIIAKRILARDIQLAIYQDEPLKNIAPSANDGQITVAAALKNKNIISRKENTNIIVQKKNDSSNITTINNNNNNSNNQQEEKEILLTPDPERILAAPRGAGLLTLGYLGPDVVSIRFDAQFEALDLDLPESTLSELDDAGSLAVRLNVGGFNFGSTPSSSALGTATGGDFSGLSFDLDLSGRSLDRNALTPVSSRTLPSVSLVFRSALSLFIFLYSARILF